jgi:putative transposase
MRARSPIDLWAYVIMPEHVHLIVAPREVMKVGRTVGRAKEQVARNAIEWMEEHAPEWLPRITVREGDLIRRRFWQPGGGYDRTIESDAALLSMISYLHQNPVRRGLVSRAEDWLWSSARWYAGMTEVLLAMDRTLPMMLE